MRSGTPQPVIDKLYDILKAGAKEEDFTRTMDMLCLDTVLLEPAKARAFLQQETRATARWSRNRVWKNNKQRADT
jgi:tripartite-type tricarboxylate transporter receptor subunit TctC